VTATLLPIVLMTSRRPGNSGNGPGPGGVIASVILLVVLAAGILLMLSMSACSAPTTPPAWAPRGIDHDDPRLAVHFTDDESLFNQGALYVVSVNSERVAVFQRYREHTPLVLNNWSPRIEWYVYTPGGGE
jgi:hypothetical protein